MAKTKAETTPKAKPNLFTKAKGSAVEKPSKSKGTVINLPKDLDDNGNLTGESRLLHEAVHDIIEQDAKEKAARNAGGAAKAVLMPHVVNAWASIAAQQSILPPTPVTVVNWKGESVSYVSQDKSGQNPIKEDQVELFKVLLGADKTVELVQERTVYALNPDTLAETAAGPKASDETVADVVFEIISGAIMESPKLSDDQKASLISATTKTMLKQNTYPRLVEICGSDVGKIESFLEAAGSAVVRYLKP